MENLSINSDLSSTNSSEIIDAQIIATQDIALLEEKLVVKRRRRKAGEVVIRKKIETRMIHIPIRREKLVVEKVGIAAEQLTEIDLGEEEVNGVKFSDLGDTNDIYQAQSQFVSLETLQKIVSEIAASSTTQKARLRLEIITDDSESQQDYQNICDRF